MRPCLPGCALLALLAGCSGGPLTGDAPAQAVASGALAPASAAPDTLAAPASSPAGLAAAPDSSAGLVPSPAASAALVNAALAGPVPGDLAGVPGDPAAGEALPGPRIYAKTRFVWVTYQPHFGSAWLGYLWLGGSAELVSTTPVIGGSGCNAWYAVKPRGYVCADGDKTTLDPQDPTLVALLPYAPRKDSAWPHKYGESRGVERYLHQPTPEEQRGREFLYDEHLARVGAARRGDPVHASLEGVDLTPGSEAPLFLPPIPSTLREFRTRLLPSSTVAWSRDYVDAAGRSWLLGADFSFIPKDRVAPYPVSDFHGVHLDDKLRLPIAFFREKPRPQYRPEGSSFVPNGATWPRLAWVQLTGQSREAGGVTYLEAVGDLWMDANDAVVPKSLPTTPWHAPVNEPDTTGRAPAGRQTWMEISVLGGWMIAYEGTRPVYVTLIAAGRGGLPTRGLDPVETAATPIGTWPVTGKFLTATMAAPHEFIHSDVPWTQNFHGPHAIHGAYWHNDWGEKKSAGCVNTSLVDGKWLFSWTDPPLPEGWHGIRWEKDLGPATQVVTHP